MNNQSECFNQICSYKISVYMSVHPSACPSVRGTVCLSVPGFLYDVCDAEVKFLKIFIWKVLLIFFKNEALSLIFSKQDFHSHQHDKLILTFSSHTVYVKRENIVIAWIKKKKKIAPFDECLCFLCLELKTNKKFYLHVCLSVPPPVCLSVCTWILCCGYDNFRRS